MSCTTEKKYVRSAHVTIFSMRIYNPVGDVIHLMETAFLDILK